ncbi:MAG: phosphatase PAP2 family protein [Bryobacteraceae bacterium]|nr:phosphatase PAP2 family protein [Bryobacteraceae bacterium]
MTVLPQVRQFIESRDHRLMRRVNAWSAPMWVRMWMIAATRSGDGWLWYAMALALAIWGDHDRFRAIGAASAAAGVGVVLFLWLKRFAGRRRPCHIQAHCWATLLPPDRFSFPSGHTITAFSICVAVGGFYPGLMPVLSFFALSIGISRIVLGMHFLSDVVAGAAIGATLGRGFYVLLR